MASGGRKWLYLLILVVAVALLLGGYVWQGRRAFAERTGEATAEITSRSSRTTRKGTRNDTIKYRFAAGGRVIEREEDISSGYSGDDYLRSRTIKVCYDPDNPEDARIIEPHRACGVLQ